MPVSVNYHIHHYDLVQGALEIQYIEEYFGEFPRKKTAAEIVRRLERRAHIILLATAPLPDDPGPCAWCDRPATRRAIIARTY